MPYEQLTPEQMEVNSEEAALEMQNMSDETLKPLANFWKKHYLKCGHKRLARLLLQHADKVVE